MKRVVIVGLAALCATYCSSGDVEVETSTTTQFGSNLQGPELHGFVLQGNVAGMKMRGFQFSGATLNGSALSNVRIEQGELVAEQNSVTLDGEDLESARLIAQVKNTSANPPTIVNVEYRITDVQEEDDVDYDPTGTGETYLYTLEQNVNGTGNWQPACSEDGDNARVAIPLTDFYDETGARVDSSTLFTFGCTNGAIGKCYRWGYRPWVTGYGNLETMHWTCTRVARADYCGNGQSFTHEGTEINVWDILAPPGPIQSHGSTPMGMTFEAGWNTSGAVCFSMPRWLLGGPLIAVLCPSKLVMPVPPLTPGTLCNDQEDVIELYPTATMFNETNLNINLDLF
jgi:hypothetical protein